MVTHSLPDAVLWIFWRFTVYLEGGDAFLNEHESILSILGHFECLEHCSNIDQFLAMLLDSHLGCGVFQTHDFLATVHLPDLFFY